MVSERNKVEAHQARLDAMIAEFRVARQRRLVKQGIALWNRTEVVQRQAAAQAELPPTKRN